MSNTQRYPVFILLVLALVMGVTRIHHLGMIPDASWAVFFVAGFYLHAHARWVLPVLFGVAVLVDAYVITAAGLNFWSHYCVSPAYWFLLPAYLSLWFGGHWLARQKVGLHWRSLGALSVALLLSASACYLLSNGSFYWLSDSWGGVDAQRSVGGWFANMGHWYWPFLKVTAMYVAIAALVHAAVLAAGIGRHVESDARSAV